MLKLENRIIIGDDGSLNEYYARVDVLMCNVEHLGEINKS